MAAVAALPAGNTNPPRRVVIPESDRDEMVNIAVANRWTITRPFTNMTIYRRRSDEIRVIWRKDGTARFAGKNMARGDWGMARGAGAAFQVREWMQEKDWLEAHYERLGLKPRKKWWEED